MSAARIAVSGTLFFLLLATAGRAEAQQGFELTAYGGVAAFLGDDPVGVSFSTADVGGSGSFGRAGNAVRPGPALGVAARQRIGARWAVEVGGLFTFMTVAPPGGGGGVDVRIRTVASNLVYHVPLGGSAEGFVTAGAGPRWYVGNETVAYPSWNLGAGVTWPLGAAFDLRIEGRNQMAVTDVADFQPQSFPNPSDRRFQSDLLLLVGLTLHVPRESRPEGAKR